MVCSIVLCVYVMIFFLIFFFWFDEDCLDESSRCARKGDYW